MGYQEMLHGELLPFVAEIEGKRQFFNETSAVTRTAAARKN